MQELHSPGLRARVFYSPLEAAIAWAGLAAVERQILALARGANRLPADADVSQWPQLRLCADRIFDALVHFELPFGRAGITSNDPDLLDDPALTIRHVDLKAWMIHFYPDQRPSFLFDAFERHLHPAC